MGIFSRNNNDSQSNDCSDLGQVIRDQHNGNRGVELVMSPDGEMVAVPQDQVEETAGVKATGIAKKDYYSL